jgi:hypothetical protein
MHIWKIKVILKSGKEVTIYYGGQEKDSEALSKKFLPLCAQKDCFVGFLNEESTENIFIKMSEIASMSFSCKDHKSKG